MSFSWCDFLTREMERELWDKVGRKVMGHTALFRKTAKDAVKYLRENKEILGISSRDANRFVSAILNAQKKIV